MNDQEDEADPYIIGVTDILLFAALICVAAFVLGVASEWLYAILGRL